MCVCCHVKMPQTPIWKQILSAGEFKNRFLNRFFEEEKTHTSVITYSIQPDSFLHGLSNICAHI